MPPNNTTSDLPVLQKAVIQDKDGKPTLSTVVPLPKLLPGTVLVKTTAVALNPCDWKIPSAFPTPGAIIGNDFAGKVVAIGPSTQTALQVGDTVCGMIHGANPADASNGTFAQYVRADPKLLLRVPPSFKVEQAASLGQALATNCLSLWGRAYLALEAHPGEVSKAMPPTPVLVYGGSTATGTVAIQLLRSAGYEPVATCSPHNFELVRGYGASAVFDYTDPGVADKIRKHTGGKLRYVLDCITDEDSVRCCYAAIGRLGGRYAGLELCPDDSLLGRRAVKAGFPIAMEIFGKEVKLSGGYEKPANEDAYEMAVHMFAVFQKLLDEGKLKSHPIRLLPKGLESVPDGLKLLKSGSVSGKKLVVPIE